MKQITFSILIILLIFSVSCGTNESTITIKAGVVMKSGDVKDVPRQEFFITTSDVMTLFENSTNEHIKKSEVNIEEAKNQIEYESRLKNLEIERMNKQVYSVLKTSPKAPPVEHICEELKAHLDKSIEIEGEGSSYFEGQSKKLKKGETTFSEIKAIADRLDKFYVFNINLEKGQKRENDMWIKLHENLKDITNLINEHEKQIKVEQNNIYQTNQKIKELDKELESKITQKVNQQRATAIESFQRKLKEAYVSSFKTNLSGEATLTLPKGKYFFFGLATIRLNEIIWSLPVTLEENEEYFELSNDNAFSISDEGLFQELLKAFAGFDISQ